MVADILSKCSNPTVTRNKAHLRMYLRRNKIDMEITILKPIRGNNDVKNVLISTLSKKQIMSESEKKRNAEYRQY